MTRQLRIFAWLIPILGIAGCGDSTTAIQRDFYNVQHEILDNMTQIVDEESAKRFNEAFKDRFKPKEEVIKERKDKIENNLFAEADREANKILIGKLETVDLRGQIESLDFRYRVMQNRLRRLVVKLVEDAAEAKKAQKQSFTLKSTEVCPNLTSLERGEKIIKFAGGGGGGGGGGMPNMMPMMQPGGPGGAGGPGGPAMPAMNPGGGGAKKEVPTMGPAADPKSYENFVFVLGYTFTGDQANPWQQSVRAWRTGNTNVTIAPHNGLDVLPLTY